MIGANVRTMRGHGRRFAFPSGWLLWIGPTVAYADPPPEPARVAASDPRPDMEVDAAELLAAAGDGFRIRETDHFRIAFDTDYEAIRPLVGRLDATFESVRRFSTACGLEVSVPLRLLPVILFHRYDDFTRYSRQVNVPAAGIAGFYHQSTNIAAFCHMLDSPQLRAISEQIERLQEGLARLDATPIAGQDRQRNTLQNNVLALRMERDAFVTKFNRTVVQHEAAHQMLYNLGVHVRGADNPAWLAEGLACQFEVPQPDPRGNLTGLNHLRLSDFRRAFDAPPEVRELGDGAYLAARKQKRFSPVADLISDEAFFQHAEAEVVFRYSQAWALVYYLHRQQREAFAGYLRMLQKRRPDEAVRARDELAEFRSFFGEPDDDFERRWIQYILRLRYDPVEAGR